MACSQKEFLIHSLHALTGVALIYAAIFVSREYSLVFVLHLVHKELLLVVIRFLNKIYSCSDSDNK